MAVAESLVQKEFNRIVAINEAIKKISILSYNVKLRALNTLIIAKKSSEGVAGFAVISFELITFSNQLQQMNDRLGALMHQILNRSTQKAKISRIMRTLEKTSLQFQLSNDETSLHMITNLLEKENAILQQDDQEMRENMKDLFLKIRETIKLCTRGRTISVFGKIESAYAVKDKEIYLQLSENVENYLDEAEMTLKQIQASWD